jgi:hypothetical protein
MPTKALPPSASLDHLKHQAKDLLRGLRGGQISAFERARAFHPRLAGKSDAQIARAQPRLSDAQLTIAREYGYASWPRLRQVLSERAHHLLSLPHYDRLPDGPFKAALALMDAGAVQALARHLARHPGLVDERAQFEGVNYFTDPTLLEFLPENPVRHGGLPGNTLEIAQVLLDAGARRNLAALDSALLLAASGRVCREAGLQAPLLRLFCAAGANPQPALQAAVAHGEFAAAQVLLDCGAALDLPTAAALGQPEAVGTMMPRAAETERQLALAALHGRAQTVATLLQGGADPNRYNPPGGHSHCTPLHSAAFASHVATVRALLAGGARRDIPDLHHNAPALGWATHAGHADVVAVLESPIGDQ